MAKQSFPSTFSLKTLLVWHKNTNLKILHEPITRFSCPPQSLSQAVDLSPPASPSASGGVSCTNLCSSPPATVAYPHGDVTSYSIKSQNQRIGGKEEPAEVRRSNSLLSKIFTHFLHLSKFSCSLSLELHLLCHLLIQELLGGLSLFRSTHSSSLACLRSTCLRMPEILAGLIACHPPLFYRKKGGAFKGWGELANSSCWSSALCISDVPDQAALHTASQQHQLWGTSATKRGWKPLHQRKKK